MKIRKFKFKQVVVGSIDIKLPEERFSFSYYDEIFLVIPTFDNSEEKLVIRYKVIYISPTEISSNILTVSQTSLESYYIDDTNMLNPVRILFHVLIGNITNHQNLNPADFTEKYESAVKEFRFNF